MKRYISLFSLGLFSLAIAACATIEGAGEDIEDLGEGISDTARDNK